MNPSAASIDYWPQVAEALDRQLVHPRRVADGKLEYFMMCPKCGAEAQRRKFSVSERGCHCFVCGASPSLKWLLEYLGGHPERLRPIQRPRPRTRTRVTTGAGERLNRKAAWQANAVKLAWEFTQTPGLMEAWQSYKPVSEKTLHEWQLGLGVFPGGLWDGKHQRRCQHPRLIVPLFERGQVAGFRCRALDCDCTRWLSPGGSRMVLYGGDSIQRGCDSVIICENPIDSLLVRQEWEGEAVATLGVSIWKKEYTALLLDAAPHEVLVCFDNDASGQTTDPAILDTWRARHPGLEPPLRGVKLTNRLRRAKLNAVCFKWPASAEPGADIGGMFDLRKVKRVEG